MAYSNQSPFEFSIKGTFDTSIKELLNGVHRGMVLAERTSQQLKTFSKFMAQLLIAKPHLFQPTALQGPVRVESYYQNVPSGFTDRRTRST